MWNWPEKLQELKNSNTPHACITITDVGGSAPREVGAKMILLNSGEFFGTIGGGHLEQFLLNSAQHALQEGKSLTKTIPLGAQTGQCCGGVVTCFIEIIKPCPQLLLFGAGHVGQAICQVLQGTPFHIHLFDERPNWLNQQSDQEHITCHQNLKVDQALFDAKNTYASILTHSHDLDFTILNELLDEPLRYLGLIGSLAKKTRFYKRLQEQQTATHLVEKITCPIGLNIGGKAPKEIAIALAAQLLGLYHET